MLELAVSTQSFPQGEHILWPQTSLQTFVIHFPSSDQPCGIGRAVSLFSYFYRRENGVLGRFRHAQRRRAGAHSQASVSALWPSTLYLPGLDSKLHVGDITCHLPTVPGAWRGVWSGGGGLAMAVERMHKQKNASLAAGARPQNTLPTSRGHPEMLSLAGLNLRAQEKRRRRARAKGRRVTNSTSKPHTHCPSLRSQRSSAGSRAEEKLFFIPLCKASRYSFV